MHVTQPGKCGLVILLDDSQSDPEWGGGVESASLSSPKRGKEDSSNSPAQCHPLGELVEVVANKER